MKIAVFGGTGRTGREVVRLAIQAGDEVSVLARSGSSIDHPRLRWLAGDVTDTKAVTEVVEGQDAVVSALGTTRSTQVAVCTNGVANIVAAMTARGVRRLVVVSAFGAADSHDRSMYTRLVWLSMRAKMEDKETMERVMRSSGLDWTIVRPPALGNQKPRGTYETSADLRMRITSRVSRADLADFILREVHRPTFVGATPGIRAWTTPAFEASETWSVRGRTCMVTGASGGMGRKLAASLARRGARVVMVCRDPERGRVARNAIGEATGNSAVELFLADLSDQAAIHRMAGEFLDSHDRLHVLINNAGAHVMRRQLSTDGVEMNLAVNHLSAFVLTDLLLPTLRLSAPARIVNVASRAMTKSIDLDNLNWDHDFAPWTAYGQAKLAMVLCSYRLARQLAATGVEVNAVHPGLTATDIVDDIASPRLRPILPVIKAFLLSPERGAQAALRLATSAELTGVSGAYFKRGRRRRSAAVSYDLDLQDRTWQASIDLVVAPLTGNGDSR